MDGLILIGYTEVSSYSFGLAHFLQHSNIHQPIKFLFEQVHVGLRNGIRAHLMGLGIRRQINVYLIVRIAAQFTTKKRLVMM